MSVQSVEASAGRNRTPVAVVTGSRAEFGLLRPVMKAIAARPELDLLVVAAGSHLVPPAETLREIKAEFNVADLVPMQVVGREGRFEDAEAAGRGIQKFARSFERLMPAWIVVLGDRIEAFAAGAAASIAGIPLAHIHGGDRAEGVADEAMRHALTKLAHLHLAATATAAERIVRMGEKPEHVHVVGSPAIDGLAGIPELDDKAWEDLGAPDTIFLMHPVGRSMDEEHRAAAGVLDALRQERRRVLAMSPNLDPGRTGIVKAIDESGYTTRAHLPRDRFAGAMKRLSRTGGVLVGNSSAGLIEAAALQVPTVNIGPRQAGRERAGNVVDAAAETPEAVREALVKARAIDRTAITHPYGDGKSGERISDVLARTPGDASLLRKRNTY
ncbi:MAG: UDP-N-acetylglucosamine 2-epimerase [Vicinamibacterales bacterium]